MSNQMPIYSHVVQKSNRERAKTKNGTREKQNPARSDFDPLNHNNGGQFVLTSPTEAAKERKDRRKEEPPRVRRGPKIDPNEGKVEAYLRQNQMSIRQQQHRHSAVRQAEHRVNLRSLPLNEVTSSSRQERTPTDRHRAFPERERDGAKEHKRERNRDREFDVDASPLSPHAPRVRKSTSSQRVAAPCIAADARRFFCREWILQKLAHSLEQRTPSRSPGLLILGDAGSGKTALCQELSEPGQGPQARQQRALNRRLLARHFLLANRESSLTPAEFIRSVAMQILSHSTQHKQRTHERELNTTHETEESGRRNSEEEELVRRFKDLGADDGEDSCKPLLGDSEDQRSDDEECMNHDAQIAIQVARRTRTIDRMHENEDAVDVMPADELPQILPRNASRPTNPFLADEERRDDARLYENHENLFLRNVSQRKSKEMRLPRQSSEPISTEQKTDSASENERSKTDSPCKSRIPVANFKYPNKSEVSLENSPKKPSDTDEPPEYTNLQKDVPVNEIEVLLEKKRSQQSENPPPIPTLPISPRTSIANAYYEKLLSDPDIQMALLPQALEKDPDECFKRALLYPLLSVEPKQSLFLLVDAVDEGCSYGQSKAEKLDSTQPSTSICVLLSRHQHLLPPWLLLVCTAGKQARITGLLQGFRKITLDELQKPHVSADIQRYVLARLDTEPRLRARVSSDAAAAAAAAAALDYLRIKSDGCLLYLEKVLDGVADGFIALREIKEIPGTLNGLYLWLCQRLFHGRRFNKVRLLLDVLLAARCGVTEEMLYRCLLTKECGVTREDFNRRLHLLRRILVMDRGSRHVSIFHHSFASWLTDVKHCTRRYLCSPADGHAALAMYYTLDAARLTALEVHHYVLHMTHLEQHLASLKKNKSTPQPEEPLPLHTLLLLWVLDSGCDVEAALRKETDIHTQNIATQTEMKEERDGETESVGNASTAVLEHSPISSLLRGLQLNETDARWPKDARLLRALTQLASVGGVVAQSETTDQLCEAKTEEEKQKEEDAELEEEDLDPTMVHELATRGDEDTLIALLKRHPHLIESTDGTGGTALHAAARAGRAAAASALLRAGARPDAADSDGWSPLRAAAWAGHIEVVDVLLQHGCCVDTPDGARRTALRAAAWSGHEPVVARLLAAGAAPDRPDAEGRTPLIAAAYMGHAEIVRQLLDAGAGIDEPDDDGRTALSVASLCGAGAGVTALLLERGADPARADRDGATPLLVAAFEGHTDICELLLEASADIEATDAAGRAALWAAAAAGHAQTARLLLFWGASVDHMDQEGRTVLTIAAAQGNVEVVRQLLDRGLDEHHRDNSGWTPLHYAAFEGHIEVCTALLEAGAVIDTADNDGKTALMLAAQEGHAALVDALAQGGARLETRAHDGKTALRLAALEGHFPAVGALLARGARVDALDADRRSVLYVLALDDRLGMARYLLQQGGAGASVDARDAEGRTPLHVSAWQGHNDMVNLLIKVGGAAVDGRDRCARTALHAAAWRGRAAVLRTLLEHGADVAAVCTQGATPLGIAAQEGHEECVLLLLQYGADPLQADHCGRTPARVAWRAGHAAVCRLLEQRAAPSAPAEGEPPAGGSPDYKRRSVHSSSSTKCSSTLSTTEAIDIPLSFAQQVAKRGRRERDRDNAIPEHRAVEQDSKLRSYMANERDADIVSYVQPRASAAGDASPLYASPPRSPRDARGPAGPAPALQPQISQPAPAPAVPDTHFARDTHMRIILGRESGKLQEKSDAKNKRNGIVTNPAMRLVANVRNGLDSAAANIRRTGASLAASASSANPAVRSHAFQWRKETPL